MYRSVDRAVRLMRSVSYVVFVEFSGKVQVNAEGATTNSEEVSTIEALQDAK